MKTKNDFLNRIETYVKTYVPPTKPNEFVPVVFTVPFEKSTDEHNVKMMGMVVELVERTNPKCAGRVVIGMDLTKSVPHLWVGVALLPLALKDKDYLISDVPFKQIFERAG